MVAEKQKNPQTDRVMKSKQTCWRMLYLATLCYYDYCLKGRITRWQDPHRGQECTSE